MTARTVCFIIAWIFLACFCIWQAHRMIVLKKREKELEECLKETDISIMLSQIQPHFLYNSLSTIRELCREDPEKAQKALDFCVAIWSLSGVKCQFRFREKWSM